MTTTKYPIGGYAPGNYYGKCKTCGEQYQGDKYSVQCEPCAVKVKEKFDALPVDQQNETIKRNAEKVNEFFKSLNP